MCNLLLMSPTVIQYPIHKKTSLYHETYSKFWKSWKNYIMQVVNKPWVGSVYHFNDIIEKISNILGSLGSHANFCALYIMIDGIIHKSFFKECSSWSHTIFYVPCIGFNDIVENISKKLRSSWSHAIFNVVLMTL